MAAPSANDRFGRNRRLHPKTTFSRLPPIHRANPLRPASGRIYRFVEWSGNAPFLRTAAVRCVILVQHLYPGKQLSLTL
jgi:hypothetical protein